MLISLSAASAWGQGPVAGWQGDGQGTSSKSATVRAPLVSATLNGQRAVGYVVKGATQALLIGFTPGATTLHTWPLSTGQAVTSVTQSVRFDGVVVPSSLLFTDGTLPTGSGKAAAPRGYQFSLAGAVWFVLATGGDPKPLSKAQQQDFVREG